MRNNFKYIAVFISSLLIGLSVDIIENTVEFSKNDYWKELSFQTIAIITTTYILHFIIKAIFTASNSELYTSTDNNAKIKSLYFIQAILFLLYFKTIIYFFMVSVFIAYIQYVKNKRC
ncbi:MAG: hypothetical protein COW15_06285 [Shewanella sp. CG12_big_fil_rev_8_21_14_0_65_47_15]|nr:MAG: hypothetical protein COW15_06285 [Shewanella sp. CG12_big_fil_rev_8_21_14_0_65_47_15]